MIPIRMYPILKIVLNVTVPGKWKRRYLIPLNTNAIIAF
jgi:hypothetical protein